MMTQFPNQLGLQKWADMPFNWQGVVSLDELPRVYQLLDGQAQINNNPTLEVQIHLARQKGVLWLQLAVTGQLWLTCDRCLEPLAKPVTGNYELAIVHHDEELSLIGEAEYVRLDELEGDKMLPIAQLLQDELLLGLPLAVTHSDCEMAHQDDDDDTADHPFAILATLKSSSKDDKKN